MQHEPALLLPNAKRLAVAPYKFVGQSVSEPVRGHTEQLDISALQTDLLAELAIHGFFGILTDKHAALRKLPALATCSAGQHQPAIPVSQDDADVGAESLTINP